MRSNRMGPGGGFNVRVTALSKQILITLVTVYVIELIALHWLHLPIVEYLFLTPIGMGHWAPWQPFTALFLNNPAAPISAALDWLMIYFFWGTVQDLLGKDRLLRGLAAAVVTAAIGTTLLDAGGALTANAPFVGLNPVITALVVFFGLSIPHAQILLFFVLPVRASWVAYGSGLLILLYFLSSRDLGSSMALFGWVGAWGWMNSRTLKAQLIRPKTKKKSPAPHPFTVYPGGQQDDTVH